MSAKADGTLEAGTKAESFLASNCSSTPPATQTTSANASMRLTGSADSPVKLSTNGATTTAKLDNAHVAIPPYQTLMTGSAVHYLTEQGQAKSTHANKGYGLLKAILGTFPHPLTT